MADILENPVDLIDDDYEQEIQVEQEMIEVVAYRSYNRLDDKPQINGVELVGNKTSSDLGITAQIESAVNSEAQARAQADNTLQGKIDTEKLARQQADSTLQGNIDAEETARKAADKDIQDVLDGETLARQNADTALGGRIDTEIHDRQVADIGLQGQIDAITSKSDVVDVVATYADLQAYDTQHLGDNDVIKVLDDETHEDALTYYRWSTATQTWSYIGQEAPYYSKGQMDVKLAEKQDKLTAGANIQIQNGTISATDTTYAAGNGLNLNGTEFSADTTVLATKADLEGYYTKPETDNLLAPKLEAEVVAELPTTGEEGKLYLTPKAHTTQTATGNPITATVAEEAGALESFQLDGDTTQTTYAGKNLINPIAISGKNNGITYSFDQTTNEITLNGTATGKSTCYFSSENRISLDGEYTLSYEKVSGSITPSDTCRIEIAASSWGSNTIYLALQDSSASITATKTFDVYAVDFNIGQGTICNNFKIKLQLEKSASATSFEPFVGGQPSPSPDYPQQIQTVTGEQTVTVTGKNLFDGITTNQLILSDGTISSNGNWNLGGYIKVSPNTTYTVSFKLGSGGSHSVLVSEFDSNKDFIIRSGSQSTVPYTFTTSSTTEYIRLNYNNTNNDTDFQLELGSTATTYTPYSKQTLSINLGSIELCKLGTYQDYIWKDGNDWKVHKATGKTILTDSTSFTRQTYGTNVYATNGKFDDMRRAASETVMLASSFGTVSWNDRVTATSAVIYQNLAIPGEIYLEIRNTSFATLQDLTTYLGNRPVSVYYELATPTDTTITDTTLITQLEAIRTASLENGTNTISNTATGSNLAGDMEIGYYGYNPTNRYDKFIWLDLNNNYEQIGS